MTTMFSYQPVPFAKGTPDRERLLLFWGADLLAGLVRPSPETHDDQGGVWFSKPSSPPVRTGGPLLPRSPGSLRKYPKRLAGPAQTEDLRPLEYTRTLPHKTFD